MQDPNGPNQKDEETNTRSAKTCQPVEKKLLEMIVFFVSSRLIMILHGAAVRLQFDVEFINFQFVRHYCAQLLCAIIVRNFCFFVRHFCVFVRGDAQGRATQDGPKS